MTDLPPSSLAAPAPAPAWHSWLETGALCALALTAGALLASHSPPALHSGLAWLALAPLLAGLRYGAGRGVTCGAVQAGALLVAARWGGTAAEAPLAELALGWLVAGLVPGQFRDAWGRRLEQAEGEAGELRARLSGLARDHHALRISHDRLQREAPGSPFTLRDALAAFERELGGAPGTGSLEAIGGKVLALFRECASVRAATLHLVDRRGEVGPAVAELGTGEGEGLAGSDALIQEAVRLGEVVSVRELPVSRGALAAVPLVDPPGRVRAVVAIRELPFLSLQADTLAVLAGLGAYAGAALARAERPSPAAEEWPVQSGRSFKTRLEAQPREDGLVA